MSCGITPEEAGIFAGKLRDIGFDYVRVPSSGMSVPRVIRLDGAAVASIGTAALRDRLVAGKTAVLDLDTTRRYAQGRIPGAWFALRSRLVEDLGKDLDKLPNAEIIVPTSPDGALARLAAAELAGSKASR